MAGKTIYLILGSVFGFALSRVGASEYDLIFGMFTGMDWTLVWVILTAIVVGHLGMRVLTATGGKTRRGENIVPKTKPLRPATILGGAIMGIGWGLSGACPGTVLAQLGEGKIIALGTIFGLLAGTYFYALLTERGSV